MGKIKKNRNQDKKLQTIVLVTAIIQLIAAAIKLIELLTKYEGRRESSSLERVTFF